MASDRFRRKETKTLKQRWDMKHKDRADDIPNCPSIEDIINMPTSPSVEQGTSASPSLSSVPPSIQSSNDVSVEPATTSTARETSSTENREVSTIPKRTFSRSRSRRQRRSPSKRLRKRFMKDSPISGDFAILPSASERRDDIPMCPNIEDICDINEYQQDDDMSVQRFSHAFYQLLDDFFVLINKMAQFSKQHPRPSTIVAFIVASYLIICYMELSIAAFIELAAQATWPICHAFFLFVERFSHNLGSFLRSSDDIIQGAYCDVAEIWCRNFQMMCAERCSFFNLALERMRKN